MRPISPSGVCTRRGLKLKTCRSPFRSIVTSPDCSGCSRMILTQDSHDVMDSPFQPNIRSPMLNPASAAAPSGSTWPITAGSCGRYGLKPIRSINLSCSKSSDTDWKASTRRCSTPSRSLTVTSSDSRSRLPASNSSRTVFHVGVSVSPTRSMTSRDWKPPRPARESELTSPTMGFIPLTPIMNTNQ